MSIAPIVVVATLCLSADQPAGATQRPSREALARFVSAARTAEINRLTAELETLDNKVTALDKSRKNVRRDLTIFVLDRVPTDGLSDISADQ